MANPNAILLEALSAGVREILDDLIDGSIEDLDGPVRQIASRLTFAVRRNRLDLAAECRDQLALIVMEKELRLRHGGDGVLEAALGMGLNALLNGAIGGLSAARGR